jgi:hypothetical protein
MREAIEDVWDNLVDEIEERGFDHRLVIPGTLAIGVAAIVVVATLFSLGASLVFDEPSSSSNVLDLSFNEAVFMPRAEECIDEGNGQDSPEFAIGYEPSLAMDSAGNLFITAHKDLRWGGTGTPLGPILGGPFDFWYACEEGEETTWDYWASWLWKSNDGGLTWGPGDNFEPTPGNHLMANYLAGGSECLGDEGDIAVDGEDVVYYLDTTLEDNWWHKFLDGGNTYEGGICDRMNTMAADDRPWVAAQGDGIVHYLGNSGASPPECSGDVGRYWYYHSENGGDSFSQCYAMPGGWSTIAAEADGTYVYVAQESSDGGSGNVIVRISDDYGRGTGPSPSDGTWQEPVSVGPRNGNCPEGYPVIETNEVGTVAVIWADCPDGGTGPWDMRIALSYDRGINWSEWEITPFERGMNMYPFVSISDNDVISVAFYGLDFDQNGSEDGYTAGKEWFLYAGALQAPQANDSWDFSIADPAPLHTVTSYEESNGDTHALHDFFETVISADGSRLGIAYQQNIGLHPFEDEEEQRYIKFVSVNISGIFDVELDFEIDGAVDSTFASDGFAVTDSERSLFCSSPAVQTWNSITLRSVPARRFC